MLLESKLIISMLALVILILSFVASFKHQNSLIFVVGLITCIALTRCDDWAPGIRSFVSTFGATGDAATSSSTTTTTDKKPAAATTAPEKKPAPPGAFWLADPPKDVAHTPALVNKDMPQQSNLDPDVAIDAQVAQDLFTGNISKLETLNENVFKGDRPTEAALYAKTLTPADLLKLVPDFPTMGHVLTSTLNDPQLPSLDMKLASERTPNPETKKLEKYGLVAAPDFFPNCKAGGLGTTSEARDPASTLRCNRPSIY